VFQVHGTIADPSWGNWTAKGSFDSSKESPTSGDVALNLDTPHADVTMVKLRSLPFVSKKVWKAVQAEGATPVHFALAFNTARKGRPGRDHRRKEQGPHPGSGGRRDHELPLGRGAVEQAGPRPPPGRGG